MGKRIQSSVVFYKNKQPAIFSSNNFMRYWDNADKLWEGLCEILRGFSENELPTADIDRMDAEKFEGEVCCLCFLPIGELPNLKWEFSSYHSSCANFYCNRVSTSPPA